MVAPVTGREEQQGQAVAAPPNLSKRTARSIEMQARLLDAAEDLFASEGPMALTNRRIGERAGTTTQAIYTYFGSRDALVEAMYQRAVDAVDEIIMLASSVVPSKPDEDDIIEAFKQAARQYRQFCLAHPARFRMVRGAAADVGLVGEAADLRERLLQAISTIGRSGASERNAAYEARIHLTVAALHGFFEAELDGLITEAHNPAQLYEELVLRCLVPIDLVPPTW